ncbi:conjugal transfer TrbH protein [Legionella geestiana]|uniref:Conjugal transfer TrbH protein n=1 Tax=Legionella geestiana TaxID=45065 RepID=A0A0W0U891_9GAMM|nr:conjugal transfer protein TrbH [Legionella geestiana]KTD03994.1 conjugal transfer TrbH protein [Legionella geestiana]QBS12854.1 conjugal transfer protein TrbH [Legionella geestiana]STX54662.1 conjugal transfer TrbH protein [Legionella geestiana]
MKKISLLLLIVLLSSCTTMRYGNFTAPSQGKDIYLAQDAVMQITRIYPPAQNTFRLNQKVTDGFGMNLIHEMRKKGYGVIENVQPRQNANFFYVVDELEPGQLYRVSLYINTQALSRLYESRKNQLTPVSAWSHKE